MGERGKMREGRHFVKLTKKIAYPNNSPILVLEMNLPYNFPYVKVTKTTT